ncbi:MAG: chromate efflux transporter [Pseudomonadota bacterium]
MQDQSPMDGARDVSTAAPTSSDGGPAASQPASAAPSFAEAFQVWAKIGIISFGGPAGQIALMHRTLVDEKRWLDEPRFLNALNFCMLLPGPEAMQLATYAGWRLHGVKGGLTAGLCFVLPGALVVLALSAIYALFGNVPLVEAAFVGIKAAVLAIVIGALLKIAQRALKRGSDWVIAAAAFVAIFALAVPFPVIILAAALFGFFRGIGTVKASDGAQGPASKTPALALSDAASANPTWSDTVTTVVVWLAVWLVPLAVLAFALGPDHVLAQIGWFFSKLAVVTFGGAYAVLAYMAQEAVQGYGWLKPGEMLDGLGLAETTPGPLILVTQFVGFLAGLRAEGGDAAWAMALAAVVVTLWATFAPCFLWIFAGAPYVERLNDAPRLKSALAGVTAAVVGVILNLSVWFTLHVLFATVGEVEVGPFRLALPDLATYDAVAVVLAAVALAAMFIAKRGVLTTLVICAGAALVWHGLQGLGVLHG